MIAFFMPDATTLGTNSHDRHGHTDRCVGENRRVGNRGFYVLSDQENGDANEREHAGSERRDDDLDRAEGGPGVIALWVTEHANTRVN
jgi:hypothetical protein